MARPSFDRLRMRPGRGGVLPDTSAGHPPPSRALARSKGEVVSACDGSEATERKLKPEGVSKERKLDSRFRGNDKFGILKCGTGPPPPYARSASKGEVVSACEAAVRRERKLKPEGVSKERKLDSRFRGNDKCASRAGFWPMGRSARGAYLAYVSTRDAPSGQKTSDSYGMSSRKGGAGYTPRISSLAVWKRSSSNAAPTAGLSG